MALTSAELFAAHGDEWNRPNVQIRADRREGFRTRHESDGAHYHVPHDDFDGYEPVALAPFRREPSPRLYEPARTLDPQPRLHAIQRMGRRRYTPPPPTCERRGDFVDMSAPPLPDALRAQAQAQARAREEAYEAAKRAETEMQERRRNAQIIARVIDLLLDVTD